MIPRSALLIPVLFLLTTGQNLSDQGTRNIIFMVPDGMGISNVTAARTYLDGPGGVGLPFEDLSHIGYQRTYSKNSFVTDSAAASSAWASGEKFNNGEISCHDEDSNTQCESQGQTILELAREQGRATGLVATSGITHATPAAWGAHAHTRQCESEIFTQYYTGGVDVLLGGWPGTNRSPCGLPETSFSDTQNLVAAAVSGGYAQVSTREELDLFDSDSGQKLLGLFNTGGGLTPQYRKSIASTQPTLTEMTQKALEVLEKDPQGFFLLVEGSQVDWANHARNLPYMLGEMADFANAVQAVRDWIAVDPVREAQTMLIVVADHETGGVALTGPYGSQAEPGDSAVAAVYQTYENGASPGDVMTDEDGQPVMAPRFTAVYGANYQNYTSSAGHSAEDTLIWSNHAALGKALINTDLHGIMRGFLEGTLQ